MNKNRFYLLAIVLLLISNLVLFYFLIKKPNFDADRPKNIIIKRLNLDENQIQAYQKLIDQHRKDIKASDQELRELKNELYLLLAENDAALSVDSLISKIANLQKNIESIHFKHFLDIKKLCKPEQLNDFVKLSKNLAEIFHHKK